MFYNNSSVPIYKFGNTLSELILIHSANWAEITDVIFKDWNQYNFLSLC